MTSHKDQRRALLGAKLTAVNFAAEMPNSAEKSMADTAAHQRSERVMSGAVGAVSRSLDQMQQSLKNAQALAASGEHVVELDPAQIENSFLRDRLEVDQTSQGELVEAIRQGGQQVPILVRPLAGRAGAFQVAYGHRRVAAARTLGRKVLAIVRELNDRELLVAQGQENSARRDLSYIERASFALRLEGKGIEREAIMSALGVDKTEMSRLISVASSLPMTLIEAIGPAPKAGRPRWMALAAKAGAKNAGALLEAALAEPKFAALGSDERFALVFEALSKKAPKRDRKIWVEMGGEKLVHINRTARAFKIEIDARTAPQFGEYVTQHLPELYAAYQAKKPRQI